MNSFAPMPKGQPDRRLRSIIVPLAALVCLAGLALVVGCGDDESSVTFPPEPDPYPELWFFDVQGTAANDVWVSGNVGVMYHFDGANWSLVEMGSDKAITKIFIQDQNTAFACGHGGKIWRNTGGGWTTMSSGTNKNLYAIGSYGGQLHAVGHDGVVRRLGGGGWNDVAGSLILRDPTREDAPIDTLSLSQDVASLTTVNHFFIGGAFRLPTFDGPPEGTDGTDGMVLGEDTYIDPDERFDWLLRPVRGSRASNLNGLDPEWILCTTSDEQNLPNNYLGTSKGWLFQLEENSVGTRAWTKNIYRVTTSEDEGIRDMWVDADDNLYMVTSDGQVAYQDPDGVREIIYEQKLALVGIWGTGPDNLYLVGYMDETILHAVHDPGAGTFIVEQITLPFPDKSRASRAVYDEIGRPRS